MIEKRACFDFEVDFSNGGGLQGQDFRLDIDGPDISDRDLSEYIIQDLRLLMVGSVRILNKRILDEPHKRNTVRKNTLPNATIIDLSHMAAHGTIDHTQIDTPSLEAGPLSLDRVSNVEGVIARLRGHAGSSIDWESLAASEISNKAVLIETGWCDKWGTENDKLGQPYLTEDAARYLRDKRAALVGIDTSDLDDKTDSMRPAHDILTSAGIPIVRNLTNLDRLPTSDFRFSAVPSATAGAGKFPVRAHAILNG